MLKKSFVIGLFLFASGTLSPIAITQSAECTYPAQVLDLTNWKETLPIGSSGSPTEIKQPTLSTYSHDPYFVVNSECNGVQFRAPVNGITTSSSSYPRSELREMADNGTTNASWATNSGVHTMFIDETITAVPITKRHIVVGQVHGSSDDIIAIRLEYPKLFIDINGIAGPTLNANYTFGERFTVKFVASNGQISIYYNGSASPAYTLNKVRAGNYFKAGAYTQSNCSKELSGDCVSTNYGEVMIYNVWIAHSPLPTPPPSSPPSPPPTNSIANNNTLIAHSNNFSGGYEPARLWDGCYGGILYDSTTCTVGGRDISSFWLEFDFGKLYDISQARLYGDADGEWVSKTWALQYKKDLSDTWTTVFSDKNAFMNGWSTEVLSIKARYIRVEVLGDNINFSPGRTQAREFEIYGTEAVVTPSDTIAPTNPITPAPSGAGGGGGGSFTVVPPPSLNTVRDSQQILIEQLNARITELKERISTLKASCIFSRYLSIGLTGEDVRCLQRFLNATGFPVSLAGPGSSRNETSYFGLLTKQAVIAWQNANASAILAPLGLTSGTGFWGPSSLSHYKKTIAR